MFARTFSLATTLKICVRKLSTNVIPLKSVKPKSQTDQAVSFLDIRKVKTKGGKGGNGCISFMHVYMVDKAGPDGGDGGNGGHVIFKPSKMVNNLSHVKSLIVGNEGEKGYNKDCHGKCAEHTIIDVPVGTIVRNGDSQVIVADLDREDLMFIAARGGAGGRGNHFFVTDVEQTPRIAEYGAEGEEAFYILELKSMAHIGLIGYPNAGKSTLLRAMSRARPKVAPYPFTTLRPHIGMVQYDDYVQIAVADLPGIIEDSHKNKGLGIQFLKHAERCAALLYVLDMSQPNPWLTLEMLQNELKNFNEELLKRPQIIIANKIDLIESEDNLKSIEEHVSLPIIKLSAKTGQNLTELLLEIRNVYDSFAQSRNEAEPPSDF